jgi:hypothetical protein
MEHFAYYTLRIRSAHAPDAPARPTDGELCGVVERLDTGEKHGFASGQELLRLVGGWTSGPNMHAGAEAGNAGVAGSATPGADRTRTPDVEAGR